MTHYTIDYKGLNRQEKMAKAYQDAVKYAGVSRMENIVDAIVEELKVHGKRKTLRYCINAIPLLAGISGPPAAAIMRVALQRFNNQRS